MTSLETLRRERVGPLLLQREPLGSGDESW